MATFIAKAVVPRSGGSALQLFARSARLTAVIGSTGLLGAHCLVNPPLSVAQCQGGVAPRYQYTQADSSLRQTQALPIDMQQFSSGSVLGLVLGYLTAKIGRIFLFSFGGFFLLGALLRYQGYIPSPWPFIRRVLHLEPEELDGADLIRFFKKNPTFKVSFIATFTIGLLYS